MYQDEIYKWTKEKGMAQTCIPFSRSETVCNLDDDIVREQFNALTGVLDLSVIYGSSENVGRRLIIKEEDLKEKRGSYRNLGYLAEGERWNLPAW